MIRGNLTPWSLSSLILVLPSLRKTLLYMQIFKIREDIYPTNQIPTLSHFFSVL